MKKLKTFSIIAIAAIGIILAITACTVTVGVTSVTLDKSELAIDAIGGTDTLYAVITPWLASDLTVSWASSDEAVVTAVADTADGLKCILTGVAAGTADVTVTTTDGAFTATCTVTVTTAGYEITGTAVNIRQAVSATQTVPAGGTVEVTTFGSTTVVKSATIATDGTYTLTDVPPGDYIVKLKNATISSVPWVGVPASVRVSGDMSGVGVLAYDGTGLTNKAIIIATWENKAYDVDSYSVLDDDAFYVDADTAKVYYGSKTYSSTYGNVALERDVLKSDLDAGKYPVETTLVNSLTTNSFLRFYVQVYTASGSVTGNDGATPVVQPAGVTVYVMYSGTHYGTWYAPLNTGEAGVGFVKMRGNADGSLTIGSFNWDGTDITNGGNPTGIRSLTPQNTGVLVGSIE